METAKNDLIEKELVLYNCSEKMQADLKSNFEGYYIEAKKWEEQAKTIVVTEDSQIEIMKQAKAMRLAMKEIRVNVEKRRKELKEESLNTGRAIDSIAKKLTGLITPIEEHLTAQEKYVEIKEMKRRSELKAKREDMLAPFCQNMSLYKLEELTDEEFTQIFETNKLAFNARIEQAAKEEEARKASEAQLSAEREQLKAENEKMKLEKEEAENKLKEKEATEEAERKAKEAAEEKAKSASDNTKLLALAESLEYIQFPSCEKEVAKALLVKVSEGIEKLVTLIITTCENENI